MTKRLRRSRMTVRQMLEADRLRKERAAARAGMVTAMKAFTEKEMAINARIIVWTRGQMNGVRSMIRRLGLVGPC